MKKSTIAVSFCVMAVVTLNMLWFTYIKVCSYLVEPIINNETISIKELAINNKLLSMSLHQKIASLLIFHKSGTDVNYLQDYLNNYQPGGIIFMGDNIPNSTDELTTITNQLQSDKRFPYLFAIDGEGGVVNRLSADIYPAAGSLKYLPVYETELAFKNRSILLNKVGINLNFGIVADISDNSESFIYQRVFGFNPTDVGDRVASAVKGSKGLTLSTLKHYPGHGETDLDSHTSIPSTDVRYSTWQQLDEPPFKRGIKDGAEFVMFGHLIYSEIDSQPASLSKKWHQILIDSGFNGITITDDMVMLQQSGNSLYSDPITNAINAINAGNTMILFVTNHGGVSEIDPNLIIDGIEKSVNDGNIDRSLINSNAQKVMRLRYSLGTLKNNM